MTMPPLQSDTVIHHLVERCRRGAHAAFVAKLQSGWVILGERQVFAGYCLLLPDPVVPQLNALAPGQRSVFLNDMARVGDAVLECTGALRINYAVFGNLEPALHAHIIPRRSDEPAQTRTLQPWALDWTQAPEYCEALHGDLQRALAAHMARM